MSTPTELYINAELPKRPYTAQYPLTAGHVPVATGAGLEVSARQLDVTDVANAASETYVDNAISNIDITPHFSDSDFRIQDNSDRTKQLAFEVSAIPTGSTTTLTVPGVNVDLSHMYIGASIFTGPGYTRYRFNRADGLSDQTDIPFPDDGGWYITNTATPSKKIAFNAINISANQRRVISMPDINVDLGKVPNGLSYSAGTLTVSTLDGIGYSTAIGVTSSDFITQGVTGTFNLSKNTKYIISSNSILETLTLNLPTDVTAGDWVEIFAEANANYGNYSGGLNIYSASGISQVAQSSATTYTPPFGAPFHAFLTFRSNTWKLILIPTVLSYGNSNRVASSTCGGILSGVGNYANAFYSGIVAGQSNQTTGQNSSILGGNNNIASGQNSSIVNGDTNVASKPYTVIVNGAGNTADGGMVTVLTGRGARSNLGGAVLHGPYQMPPSNTRAVHQDAVLIGRLQDSGSIYIDATAGGDVTNIGDTSKLQAAVINGATGQSTGSAIHELSITGKSVSGTFRTFAGKYIVSCSYDGTSSYIDAVTTVHVAGTNSSPISISFSLSGNYLNIIATNTNAGSDMWFNCYSSSTYI